MSYGMGAGSWLGVSTTLAGQAAWVTASPGSYIYLPMHPGGLELKNEPSFSGQARGADLHHGRSGLVSGDGSIIFDVYPHNVDYFIIGAMNMAQVNPSGAIYEHTYTISPLLALQQAFGYTLRQGLGVATSSDSMEEFVSVFTTGIQFAVQNNFLVCTVTAIAANRSFGTVSPSFGVQVPLLVSGKLTVDVTTPDTTLYPDIPVRGLTINIPFPGRLDYSDTNVVGKKFARTEKIAPEVSWNWDWSTAEPEPKLRAAFESKTRVQSTIKITGADLGGGSLETLQFTFPHLIRKGADPKVSGAGAHPSQMQFTAQRDFANGNGAVTIFTRNGNNIT